MKEDQLMSITVGAHNIEAYHKTGEVVLSDIWRAGNAYRGVIGKPQANVTLFMNRELTKEFVKICESRNGGKPIIRKEGRGKRSKTFVSLHFAIYAAEFLSIEFHYEVIDTFINSKILEWRDESGNEFIALNQNIDSSLVDRDGKNNRGIFIQVAKMLKAHIKPDGDSWNTASADQLRLRTEIEGKISDALKFGFIKTWPELKDFLGKNFSPKEA